MDLLGSPTFGLSLRSFLALGLLLRAFASARGLVNVLGLVNLLGLCGLSALALPLLFLVCDLLVTPKRKLISATKDLMALHGSIVSLPCGTMWFHVVFILHTGRYYNPKNLKDSLNSFSTPGPWKVLPSH